MKVSEHWLREWVSLDLDSQDIADILTMAGLEVDTVSRAGPELKDVVVGKVLRVRPHSMADKLTVCQVSAGDGQVHSVVCGAENVAAGLRVPFARPGAVLPGGIAIATRKVRGEDSTGMLCSAAELGIDGYGDGLMILDRNAKEGQSVSEYLRWDDTIFDIDLTPNRGDCLSVLGIARELSVLTKARLKRREVNGQPDQCRDRVVIDLQSAQACPRYVGRVVKGLDPAKTTPLWMRERLRRCGIRPISLVVDVTNYVMLELGQPMHAFDHARLQGKLQVRYAGQGEELVLLDDSSVKLLGDTLLIADQEGPLALAGVMGGRRSAIGSDTTTIVLEAAHFVPSAIAGRARHYGLQTDSSHRFERGVDPELPVIASQYASWWLNRLAGGRAGPIVHKQHRGVLPSRQPVTLRRGQAERLLGVKLEPRKVSQTLRRISSTVVPGPGSWRVTPPSYRFDLQRECDLIEELARVDGYHSIEASMAVMAVTAPTPPESELPLSRIRNLLVDRGYQEVITYSFIDPQLQAILDPVSSAVVLSNPLAANLSVMRTSLWPGLLQAALFNLNRNQARIRLFEIGKTYHCAQKQTQEVYRLAALITGPVEPPQWGKTSQESDFYDLKADIEALLALTGEQNNFTFNVLQHASLHPGQAAEVLSGGKQVGILGGLHPRVRRQLDLETAMYFFECQLDVIRQGQLPQFRSFSRFPAIRRDLAFVVAEQTTAQELNTAIREVAGTQLVNLELFDVYRGEHIDFGRKSMAFALTFQDSSRTLKDEEADNIIEMVRAALKDRFGAELRS